MALTTTPRSDADCPDVSVKQTDTNSATSADVFDGPKSVHMVQMDNAAETLDDVYFKFYDKKSVDPASDLPYMKVKIPQGVSRHLIISDGLDFLEACSFRCTSGSGDTDTTGPSDSSTATVLVGS